MSRAGRDAGLASEFATLPPNAADLTRFSSGTFTTEQYLKDVLGKASIENTKEFSKKLAETRSLASENLRKHVYDNYKQFMVISREISKLESNMTAAQSLLIELRNINGILRDNSALDPLQARRLASSDSRVTSLKEHVAGKFDPQAEGDSFPQRNLNVGGAGYANSATLDTSMGLGHSAYQSMGKALDFTVEKWFGANPKRKLLRDGSDASLLTESNALTPKIKQLVEFYLYDDGLVVAAKKKSMLSKSKRAVIHAWLLSEISISTNLGISKLNQSVSAAPVNLECSFVLSHFSEQYVYRCESVDEKKELIRLIREAVSAMKQNLSEGEMQAIDKSLVWGGQATNAARTQSLSGFQSSVLVDGDVIGRPDGAIRDRLTAAYGGKATPIAATPLPFELYAATPASGLSLKEELSVNDLKWLDDVSEELDVYVAHRDWDEAVELLLKAKLLLSQCTYLTPSTARLRLRISECLNQLTNLICSELGSQRVNRSRTKRSIAWLLRLGLPVYAHNVFLTSRSQAIKKRIWKITFKGDLQHYVASLCIVFPLIKNTAQWYRTAFSQGLSLSASFVQWVNDEVAQFLERFYSQVFQSSVSFTSMIECIQSVIDASLCLNSVGLDIHFTLEQALYEKVAVFIRSRADTLTLQIEAFVAKDNWLLMPREKPSGLSAIENVLYQKRDKLFGSDFDCSVTESLLFFYEVLVEFLNELCLIMNMALYDPVVESTKHLFMCYIRLVSRHCGRSSPLCKNSQFIASLLDLNVVVDTFLPKINDQLKARFGNRPIPLLEQLLLYAVDVLALAENSITERFALQFFKGSSNVDGYDICNLDYSKHGIISDNVSPSPGILGGIAKLNEILAECRGYLSLSKTVKAVINNVLTKIMTEKALWSSERKFGSTGIQQFILDLQFFLRVVEEFLDDSSAEKASKIIEMGLAKYFQQNQDSKTPLQDSSWLEARVDESISRLEPKYTSLRIG